MRGIFKKISMNIQTLWRQKQFLNYLLSPLSLAYRAVMALRRQLYRWGLKTTVRFPVPVIIVGNITVGGAGKTPLVIGLAKWLHRQGWQPGIVSRGYGGSAIQLPQIVRPTSNPKLVGDEAVLLVKKTGCPMVVGKDRPAAVATLLKNFTCDIVISDDGLQHLSLGRDIEIAVIDGERRLGNGFCLPAGPLREPAKRLQSVDFIVNNGCEHPGEWKMSLIAEEIYQLNNPSHRLINDSIQGRAIHAVAAIGNPQRFFDTLKILGFKFTEHAFPDHYFFQKSDFNFGQDALIIMTEKDAVKCQTFADERYWCLAVRTELPEELLREIKSRIVF